MTREEAIRWLSGIANDFNTSDAEADALNMAIKALEQEPCEDAVSLSAIEWHDMLVADGNGQYHNERVAYKSQIDDLPPVTPKLAKCEDAVSRKAAIDAALSAFSRGLLASPDIRRLPSVQPAPQWIPCSERLPDLPIRVLVQLDNGWIITAYRQDNEWFSVPDFGEAIKDKWVEAWMPLPESYRAERK